MARKTTRSKGQLPYSNEVGVDGFPVDPQHPANRDDGFTPALRLAAHQDRRREAAWKRLELAVAVDNWRAVALGVAFARECGIPPPHWLAAAVARMMSAALRAPAGRQGRRPQPQLHYARWSFVEELREMHGLTLEAAFAAAAEYCDEHGEPEAGGVDAWRASYDEVRAAIKAGRFGEFAPFVPPE